MAKTKKAGKANTAAVGDKPAVLPPIDTNGAASDQTGAPAAGSDQPVSAASPKPKESAKPKLPAQVTLASLYGFFDDEEKFHSWAQGHVVTDPDHIELLIARGAPLAE